MIRKLPTLLAIVFIIITTTRVGDFASDAMQAGLLGNLFAVGIAAGVFVASTFNRVHKEYGDNETKKSERVHTTARRLLVFLILVETLFNLAEVNRVTDFSLWSVEWFGVQIYGIFPTIAVWLLGTLQGQLDDLPQVRGRRSVQSSWQRIFAGIADRVQGKLEAPAEQLASPAEPVQERVAEAQFPCRHCGRGFATYQGRNAHEYRCEEKGSN